LVVTPSLEPGLGSHPAAARILLNNQAIFEAHIAPEQKSRTIVIPLGDARVESVTLEVRDDEPGLATSQFRWGDLRLILGPANVDLDGLDAEVVAQWRAHLQ